MLTRHCAGSRVRIGDSDPEGALTDARGKEVGSAVTRSLCVDDHGACLVMRERCGSFQTTLPHAEPFPGHEVIAHWRKVARRPIRRLWNPIYLVKKKWLCDQYASNEVYGRFATIAHAVSYCDDPREHVLCARTSVADSECIPREPVRQRRILCKVPEAADRIVRCLEFEEKGRKWICIEATFGRRTPEVDLIDIGLTAQEVIPAIIRRRYRAEHSIAPMQSCFREACGRELRQGST
jgi:hypothetical protein